MNKRGSVHKQIKRSNTGVAGGREGSILYKQMFREAISAQRFNNNNGHTKTYIRTDEKKTTNF